MDRSVPIASKATQYAGTQFRSVLEARWALFFDILQVAWEFERTTYTLPGGRKYIPDFWLPRLRTFAEIKPRDIFENPTGLQAAENKLLGLVKSTSTDSCLFAGEPRRNRVRKYPLWPDKLGADGIDTVWSICRECGTAGILPYLCCGSSQRDTKHPRLLAAMLAAKNAKTVDGILILEVEQ